MNYLVLSIITIGLSYFYERLKKAGRISKGLQRFCYWAICLSLCLFAGLRTKYNDTSAYIHGFKYSTPNNFSSIFVGEFSIAKVYLFQIWNYVIYHFISKSANVYLFLCAMVFVCPAISLMEKYSKNFTFSILLFMFAGMYLFSLAGLKQAMATGVVLMGLPYLFKKDYVKYYLCCICSLGFHAYSIFFLIVPLLGNEIFNKRTIIFCISIILLGVSLSYFSGIISQIVELLGKEVSEETIQSGSVNILRALVFFAPLLVTIWGGKKFESVTEAEKWLIKIEILSAAFMALALFGNPILFGRIPQYFLIGVVTVLPLLIETAFMKQERTMVEFIAIICYVIFGLYSLYIDGAFAKDIFGLIWF